MHEKYSDKSGKICVDFTYDRLKGFREENILDKLVNYWWVLLVVFVFLALYLFYSINKKSSSKSKINK